MKTNNFPRVSNGFLHQGLGYKRDRNTGQYPVHPLPRWSIFDTYHRNPLGSYQDVLHYMRFALNSYQTVNEDITGSEIARTMCRLYGTDADHELQQLKSVQTLPNTVTWDLIYQRLHAQQERQWMQAVSGV